MEKPSKKIPLAHALRPTSLNEFVGQEHLVGIGKPIRKMIESGDKFHPEFLLAWNEGIIAKALK